MRLLLDTQAFLWFLLNDERLSTPAKTAIEQTEILYLSPASHWEIAIKIALEKYTLPPPEIRKVIYTTNAIESLNMSLRKVTRNRGSFPSDESLLKLFYLAQQNISKKWTMPIRDWKAALNRFAIQFEERMPQQ